MYVIEFVFPKELTDIGYLNKKGLEDSFTSMIVSIPQNQIIQIDKRACKVYISDLVEVNHPWTIRSVV